MLSVHLNCLSQILGDIVETYIPLSGGCVAQVYRLNMKSGASYVLKLAEGEKAVALYTEGRSLEFLQSSSPINVPKVVHNQEGMLIMEYCDSGSAMTSKAEQDCAIKFAELHGCTAQRYGFDFDTVIGGLNQPNRPTASWLEFFGEYRIQHMTKLAREANQLDSQDCRRIERLCNQLNRWLTEPECPALLHGDAWGGNLLIKDDRLSAVIDPACYFGDPEIELAFSTMFGTFGDCFFRHYQRFKPLRPGFFEERRDLYLVYPILVHVTLFGGSYKHDLERTLSIYGF